MFFKRLEICSINDDFLLTSPLCLVSSDIASRFCLDIIPSISSSSPYNYIFRRNTVIKIYLRTRSGGQYLRHVASFNLMIEICCLTLLVPSPPLLVVSLLHAPGPQHWSCRWWWWRTSSAGAGAGLTVSRTFPWPALALLTRNWEKLLLLKILESSLFLCESSWHQGWVPNNFSYQIPESTASVCSDISDSSLDSEENTTFSWIMSILLESDNCVIV